MPVGMKCAVSQPVAAEETEMAGFFAQAAQAIPALIYVFNHETMSNEYANQTVGQFLGYSESEVKRMGDGLLPTLMRPADLADLPVHFGRLAKLGPGQRASFEYRVTAKDGSQVWLRSVDAVMERGPEGRVLRHVGIATDITSQKLAEAGLFEANRVLEATIADRTADLRALNEELERRVAQRTAELEEAHDDLKKLTYIATHDLRVPINNMASLVYMLEEARQDLPGEHAETLAWMHEVCTQATEKLDTLICAAQAHVGTSAPFEDVSIRKALDAALLNLHFMIVGAGGRITSDLAAPTAFFLPQSMETVLQALIGNALKYRCPETDLRITVTSEQLKDAVRINVADNGRGIDLELDGERIFALFQRAHETPQGAGVSLYMVQRIVESCGGRITVESEPGAGSVFSITLPDRPDREPI